MIYFIIQSLILLSIATKVLCFQSFKYATSYVGNSTQSVKAVSFDSQGNFAISGFFNSDDLTVYDFEGNSYPKISNGGQNKIFIIKCLANGTFDWIVTLNDTQFTYIRESKFDKNDDIVMMGTFGLNVLMVNDSKSDTVATISGPRNNNAFLLKFDNNGNYLWHSLIDGEHNQYTFYFDFDSDSNILLSGTFDSVYDIQKTIRNVVFYNSDGTVGQNLSGQYIFTTYAVKYNSSGFFDFSVYFGPGGGYYDIDIAVDKNGDFAMTGIYYTNNLTFYDSSGNNVFSLFKVGFNFDVFIVKYNSTGGFLWAALIDSIEDVYYDAFITFDIYGNAIGSLDCYDKTILYDSSGAVAKNYSDLAQVDNIIVYSYNSTGSLSWSFIINGSLNVQSLDIRSNQNGQFYLSGYARGQIAEIYEPGGQLSTTMNQLANYPLNWFIAEFNSNGSFISVAQLSFASQSQLFEFDLDKNQNLMMSGIALNSNLSISDSQGLKNISVLNSTSDDIIVVIFQNSSVISETTTTATISSLAIESTLQTEYLESNSVKTLTFFSSQTQSQMSSNIFSQSNIDLGNSAGSNSQSSLTFTFESSILSTGQSSSPDQTSQNSENKTSFEQAAEFLQTPLIISVISVGGFLIVLLIVLLIFRRNRNRKTSISLESTTLSQAIQDKSSSFQTAMMTNTQTLNVTSSPLAVPLYLKGVYGTDFRPRNLLTQGGLGAIYHCDIIGRELQQRVGKDQAIVKIIKDSQNGLSETMKHSFYQELSMYSKFMQHPGFAKIYAYSEQPASIVMKFYRYGSLDSYIHGGSNLPQYQYTRPMVLNLLKLFVSAINFMVLNGFVHLDIKPDNILLDVDNVNNQLIPIVTDFGISKLFDESKNLVQAFKLSKINGLSPKYAAPEVLHNFREKTVTNQWQLPACDVYSIGVMLNELLTRRKPWSIK